MVLPAIILLIIPFFFNTSIKINRLAFLGIFSIIIAYQLFKFREIKNKLILNLTSKSINLFITVFGFTHFFIALFNAFQVILNNQGNIYSRNRLETYFDSQITSSNILFPISLISEGFFYILLSKTFIKNKVTFICMFTLYVFSISVYANTRLSVIMPLISLFCFIAYRLKKKSFFYVKYSLVILSFLLVYVQFSNQLRTGISASVEEIWDFRELVGRELDYNKYLDLADDYVKKEGNENGYGWFLGSLGNLVPRSLWPDKPQTSSSNRFTVKVTGDNLSIFNPVITFTIFGDGYLQFGYFGLILETIAFLWCTIFLFNSLIKLDSVDGSFYAFHLMVMSFIYFRAEFPFVQYFITFITIVVISNRTNRIENYDY